ncbi:organic cation transporter protein-like [Octopus vulgaris]|uniref:Organic cation transporter protein-like n=1 Tax=Octopus vulgaris TaxID=6645 RepID=A0AA36BC97_OCTVU|nr:organic cation transporter protein-like [Octopus vulgaris]
MYALILEFTSSKLRSHISFFCMCIYAFTAIVETGFAYAISSWRYLELTVNLLTIINFFAWIFLPESPRWLIERKRFREANALLHKVMKKNNLQNEEVLDVFTNNEENTSFTNSFRENIREEKVLPKVKNYTFIDLFKTWRIALITLNVCLCWMVCSMSYYGVLLNSVDMAGNRYLNYLLMQLVEFPACLFSYYLFNRFDHRKPITFFMIFGGLNCIVSNFVTEGSFWFPLILAVLGKFGIAAGFSSIYLLSAEIFPTVVRTNGLGVASMSARVGGISDKDITHILEKCGGFGPYQRWLYAYISIIWLFSRFSELNLPFISAKVPFLCYPPNFNASLIPANLTENEYLQMLQPDGDDQCSVYNNSFTGTHYTTPPSNSSKLQCSYGRKFLTEEFSSIVSEFGLVCENKWLRSTLQSVYFAGYLVGAIVFGALADRFGRRPILLLANACLVVCGVTKIFIPSFITFLILYWIQACGNIGIIVSTYALIMEFTSSELRTPVNFVFMCVYPVASIFETGFAYAISDWRHLELTACLLPIIVFFIWIFVPESPRWFIGRKRFREAEAILEEVIKNNIKQHEEVLGILTNDEEETSFENSYQENIPEKTIVNKEENYTFIDLFKTWRIALITLNICFGWMVCSMLYYGVILKSVDMAGNRYLNYLLMQIVEFPSNYVSYYFFMRFDHRKPISFFMVFSGLNCIGSNFVTEGSFWIPLILVVLGKFGIAAAFSSIYLLSAEIFPTVVSIVG